MTHITIEKEKIELALEALVVNNKEWKVLADSGDSGYWSAEDQDHYKQTNVAIKDLEEALAKQEQGGPVAVVIEESTFDGYHRKGIAWNFRLDSFAIGTKFYTTPQQRTWVELTDEQINQAYADSYKGIPLHEGIVAKFKENNT